MRGIKSWEEREAIVNELCCVRDEKLPAFCDDRTKTGELVVIAVGHLEHREPQMPQRSWHCSTERSSRLSSIVRAPSRTTTSPAGAASSRRESASVIRLRS